MIIKAKTRGDAVALGRYLLSSKNEQIEIHSVDGFLADDVMGAMREAQAQSAAIRSKQYLFSLSLSPPPREAVGVEIYEDVIRQVKERTGLADQPHIAVFHENGGRRHMHLVISRIDAETLTVKPVDFYKDKLRDLSKSIFVERGWDMPRGFIDKTERDPARFTMAEWQQAQRIDRDIVHLKMLAQEAWAASDNAKAFDRALEQRGLYLARGDRRSHVAMSWNGEVFSLPRLLNRKTKIVRERLGSAEDLRDVETTREHVRATITPMLQRFIGEAQAQKAQELQSVDHRRAAMNEAHRAGRAKLDAGLDARRLAEQQAAAARLRQGLQGLWDRISGVHRRIRMENEQHALLAMRRDREQRDALVTAQLDERAALQTEVARIAQRHEHTLDSLHRDLARQREVTPPQPAQRQAEPPAPTSAKEEFSRASVPGFDERMAQREQQRTQRQVEGPTRTRDFGYDRE